MGAKELAAGDCAVTSPSSVDTLVETFVMVPIRKPAVVMAVLAELSLPASYCWGGLFSGSVSRTWNHKALKCFISSSMFIYPFLSGLK